MIQPQLLEDKPCYIFYRLDERNSYQNFLWVFMSYTPDNAKVEDGLKGMWQFIRAKFRYCY